MSQPLAKRIAHRIIFIFDHVDIDNYVLDAAAWWTTQLATVSVMKNIRHFCNKVIELTQEER